MKSQSGRAVFVEVCNGDGYAIAADGAVAAEIEANGRYNTDVGLNYVPKGINVWEGDIVYLVFDGEGDVEWHGTWRKPSAIELVAIRDGMDPFLK